MKLCDRCRVSGCCLNYLGSACISARKKNCPDVQPNNAEIITNMAMDELASFLMDVSMGLLFDRKVSNVKMWLEATHKEDWT